MILDMVSIVGLILSAIIGYQSILIGQINSRMESLERRMDALNDAFICGYKSNNN